MKHFLLIVLFGFQINFIASQTSYHHFPTSNAVWRVDHTSNHCGIGQTKAQYQYTLGADTTIGSFSYKKVYTSGMEYCQIVNYVDQSYVGAIRYDSINKKVYFKFPDYSDTVLYNFNLQVGDTMHTLGASFYREPMSYSYIVTSIDSVLINLSYQKRFNTEHPYYSVIEGIGGTSGLIEPLGQFIDDAFTLKCFSSSLYFYPDSMSSCPLVENTVGINETYLYSDDIVITPNPLNNEGSIELKEKNNIEKIEIYNCWGKLVFRATDIFSSKFKITKNQFNSGVYTVKLLSSSKKLLTTKFIIE